jgi:hypothetical protein
MERTSGEGRRRLPVGGAIGLPAGFSHSTSLGALWTAGGACGVAGRRCADSLLVLLLLLLVNMRMVLVLLMLLLRVGLLLTDRWRRSGRRRGLLSLLGVGDRGWRLACRILQRKIRILLLTLTLLLMLLMLLLHLRLELLLGQCLLLWTQSITRVGSCHGKHAI